MHTTPDPRQAPIIDRTERWIRTVVIGLNLCPFAKPVHDAGRIRYTVSEATAPAELLRDFVAEFIHLSEADPTVCETTILIHPYALHDFYAYNDFLDEAETAITENGLDGIIQVAGFHPDYRFAGTHPDAVENYTNRSPYPMLHLLRASSVTRAVDAYSDIEGIPQRNIEMMRRMGKEWMKEMRE